MKLMMRAQVTAIEISSVCKSISGVPTRLILTGTEFSSGEAPRTEALVSGRRGEDAMPRRMVYGFQCWYAPSL